MPFDSLSPLQPLPENAEILIPCRQMPAYVGLSVQTLARWRHEGKGPKYVKIGKLVAYKAGNIREWLTSMQRSNTSQ